MMLLDTCALLWLAHDQSKISPDTLSRIESAPAVYISAISGFEIGLKCRSRKLTLPRAPGDWIREVVEHHNLSIIDLDVETCVRATALPQIHRDPCDRFIIATALAKGIPVVTGDRRFSQYGVEVLS